MKFLGNACFNRPSSVAEDLPYIPIHFSPCVSLEFTSGTTVGSDIVDSGEALYHRWANGVFSGLVHFEATHSIKLNSGGGGFDRTHSHPVVKFCYGPPQKVGFLPYMQTDVVVRGFNPINFRSW